MAETREELRDHLTAVIEAARELSKEDRAYLADTFLDNLDKEYRLVPRSEPMPRTLDRPARSGSYWGAFPWWPLPIVLLFMVPFLWASLFAVGHPPFLLFLLPLFFLFRFGRPGMRRGGPWRRPPRGQDTSGHSL